MENKYERNYQRFIYEDVIRPKNMLIRKIFPWFVLAFYLLQLAYYFIFFQRGIWNKIGYLVAFHKPSVLLIRPKTIMFLYDDILCFILYLASLFAVSALSFIVFDSTQRNKIMRKLIESGGKVNLEE